MHNRSIPARQPMGFGGLLDTTFSLYREHFLLFLGIIVLDFFGRVVAYMLGRFLPDFDLKDILIDFVSMPFGLISMGGIIVVAATIYLDGRMTSRDALKQTLHRFWHVLVVFLAWSFLYAISKSGIPFTIFSVMDPISMWTPNATSDTDPLIRLPFVLVILRLVSVPFSIYIQMPPWWHITFDLLFFSMKSGSLWVQFIPLALVPFSICFAIRWTFATTVVLLERSSIRSAFERSSELTRGRWWRVWGILISFSVLSFAFLHIVYILVGSLLTLTKLAGAATPIDIIRGVVMHVSFDADPLFHTIMSWTWRVVGTLVFPIWVIGITLLYFDLRIQKEGLNLEIPELRS